MDKQLRHATAVILLPLSILTVVGNAIVVLAVWRDPCKQLRTLSNYLVLNLATADLVLGLVCEPLFSVSIFMRLSHDLNEAIYIGMDFAVEASCLTLLALAIERYIVIEFPLHASHILTPARIRAGVAAIWGISAVIAVMPSIFIACGLTSKEYVTPYQLFLFDGIGVILITCLLGFYGRIYFLIRRSARATETGSERQRLITSDNSVQTGSAAVHMRERQVTKSIVTFLGVYTICWMPSLVYQNVAMATPRRRSDTTYKLCLLPGLLNSALNPLVYALCAPKFRKAVSRMASCSSRGRLVPNR